MNVVVQIFLKAVVIVRVIHLMNVVFVVALALQMSVGVLVFLRVSVTAMVMCLMSLVNVVTTYTRHSHTS